MSYPLLLPLTGSVSIAVTRVSEGSWDKGIHVPAEPKTIYLKASVQPLLKGTDLQMLPEGDRMREVIKIYTTQPLYARSEGVSGQTPDIVIYRNKRYEVMKVIEYTMGALDHFKAIAVRKEIT